MTPDAGDMNKFMPNSDIVPGVLKEIARRSELRQRLEAEHGRALSDDEFLEIADLTGLRI